MSFFNAFRFLTIIPLPLKTPLKEEDIGHSLAFFPLVGLIIGLLLAGISWAFSFILPFPVVTGLVLASLAVVTGALHLDGLMDSLDGLFLSGSPEKRLEIMKDSRVGSFGIVGAILMLLLKYLALTSLPELHRLTGLVLMPALSRWSVVWAIFLFPYARPKGLGHAFKSQATLIRVIVATIVALAISISLFKLKGIILMAGLWVLTMLAASFIRARISGLTGDSYGALIELGDLAALLGILILFRD